LKTVENIALLLVMRYSHHPLTPEFYNQVYFIQLRTAIYRLGLLLWRETTQIAGFRGNSGKGW
jgi:hypothetical protein